jgi:thymidylate kinase
VDVAKLVDAAVEAPVLVFGSLPPEGRDLDLVVRPAEAQALEARLAAEGFVRRGDEWARFADCSAESVDLAKDFRLPESELDALFAEARRLEGYERIVRPAPQHDLLILSRRLVWSGTIDDKRRARIDRALGEDPDAWERASRRAGAWNATRELRLLEEAYRTREPMPRGGRAQAIGWKAVTPHPQRGFVVALSGIDGSGKSSQATALRDTLERLGYDAVVAWTPLASNAWLDALAQPVKRVLGRFRSFQPAEPDDEVERGAPPNPGSLLRERSRAVTYSWATLVSVANASSQLRSAASHLTRGRVVIFDRYVLDSAVRLRFLYGEERGFRLQKRLVQTSSPTPVASFFLDVPAEVSLARKSDKWTLEELQAQERLYREEYPRLGVTRLDGQRPREELCAQIAEGVWRRLP